MMNRTKEGYKFYFNVNTMEYAWERPKEVTKDHSILTRDEIQVRTSVIARFEFLIHHCSVQNFISLNHGHDCSLFKMSSLYFQATVCEITAAHDRELLFKSNQPFIIKLQAQMKGYLARKRYKERLEFLHTQLPAVVSIQVQND